MMLKDKKASALSICRRNIVSVLKKTAAKGKRNFDNFQHLNSTHIGYHNTENKVIFLVLILL